MKRSVRKFIIEDDRMSSVKSRMLHWAGQYDILSFLDSNGYTASYGSYECLLAVGGTVIDYGDGDDGLSAVQKFHDQNRDWLFGHICYDYKNVLEPGLSTSNAPMVGFPLLQFFVPETVCYIGSGANELVIETYGDPDTLYGEIIAFDTPDEDDAIPELSFTALTDKETYLHTVEQLRQHIAKGDCYEINYCTAGVAQNVIVNPVQVFEALNRLSPAPFAAFYKLHDRFLMSASPERYIRKEGAKIISQPIKGTAARDKDEEQDSKIKRTLAGDEKELAENVMIADLVRNDLARTCEVGSIRAEELFGIYSFPQVHQMISTISGQIASGVPFTDTIRYSFPMGSMTGAPKYKVMQLIDQYEQAMRELFSGTVGYITPAGDFDFNVIIRSLFYNRTSDLMTYQTGGAITYDSVPEKEYEEMRLKAWALERIFSKNHLPTNK